MVSKQPAHFPRNGPELFREPTASRGCGRLLAGCEQLPGPFEQRGLSNNRGDSPTHWVYGLARERTVPVSRNWLAHARRDRRGNYQLAQLDSPLDQPDSGTLGLPRPAVRELAAALLSRHSMAVAVASIRKGQTRI